MDVLEHLTSEHRKVEKMMRQLADTDPGDERDRLVAELDEALTIHMLVEEKFLYPIVSSKLDREKEAEAETEHALARDGLMTLHDLAHEGGFGAAVDMLEAGVKHHVKEEEESLFPELRRKAAAEIGELDPESLEAQVKAEELTRSELYERAREANIAGRSSMTKDELVEAVQHASS
jgi:hemerythrin-like domain-containing protein